MVISAGPLTRVFTGVASRLGVHAVYLDTQKNLSVFAPRLPCFCGIAHIGYYTPVLRRTSSYFVSEKLFLSLSLFPSPPSIGFREKRGKEKGGERKEKKKCLGRALIYLSLRWNERKETRDNSTAFSWISWELKLESILSGSIVGNKHRTPFSLPPR